MNKKRLLTLLLVLCFPISIFAETIVLKSGKIVEGKLIEKTDKYIIIDFQGISLTYYLDEVESIDGKLVNISKKSVIIDVSNPGYAKPPNTEDNIEINSESTVREILKKTNYYYATRNFGKAIELGEMALKKTNDRKLIAEVQYSLSSNYLEKGIEAYMKNKDESFYKLSIQYSRKVLEVIPDSWQAFSNIGTVYFNMRDWRQAVYYFSEAEKYLSRNDPSYAPIAAERNLAEEMIRRGEK